MRHENILIEEFKKKIEGLYESNFVRSLSPAALYKYIEKFTSDISSAEHLIEQKDLSKIKSNYPNLLILEEGKDRYELFIYVLQVNKDLLEIFKKEVKRRVENN
jgi:hypothetical protein